MATSILQDAIKMVADGFNLKAEMQGGAQRLVILKIDGGETKFRELKVFLKDYDHYYNTFRTNKLFDIATTEDLTSISMAATHVAHGQRLYSIESGDVEEPTLQRPTWLFTTVQAKGTYTQ